MSAWQRLCFVTLAVGGGFAGFVATLPCLLRPPAPGPLYLAMVSAFLALYVFVTASGLLLVHCERRTAPLLLAFALQVLWFSSPLAAFRFTAGLDVSVGILGGGFVPRVYLGSGWECSVLQGAPWGVGINLSALLAVAVLACPRCSRQFGPGANRPEQGSASYRQ